MAGDVVEKALEIARRRRNLLDEMRHAIRVGDKEAVFEVACKLVGVTNEERDRTCPRVN
jgi:hypothetical protein